MSIPYIPGWWDEINKNGAITNLAQQLPSIIQPDRVAGKRLEAMIQQNPELITQISNMDPTARQAMAGALGFKNYDRSGLGNIEEGQQLQDRNAMKNFLKTATPRQQEQRLARLAGVEDSTTIDRGDTVFGLTKTKTEQDIRTGEQKEQLQGIELREAQAMETLKKQLEVSFPADKIDIDQVVDDFLAGKADTPILQRIRTDPTLYDFFQGSLKWRMDRIKMQAEKDIAGLRTQQEQFMGIKFIQMGVDNALGKMGNIQKSIDALGKFPGITGRGEDLAKLEQEMQLARDEHSRYVGAFNNAMNTEFGKKYKASFDGSTITAPPGFAAPTNLMDTLDAAKNAGTKPAAKPVDTVKNTFSSSRTVSAPSAPSPKIAAAVEALKKGASLSDLEASPAFTPQEKAEIRRRASGGE